MKKRSTLKDFHLDNKEFDRRLLTPETEEALEEFEDRGSTLGEKITDVISDFCGSGWFVWLHVLWFAGWLAINSWSPVPSFVFDKPPFGILTLIVSLEAIFLSTFLLMSQKRTEDKDRARAVLDFKLSRQAEEKICDLSDDIRELRVTIEELTKELNGRS